MSVDVGVLTVVAAGCTVMMVRAVVRLVRHRPTWVPLGVASLVVWGALTVVTVPLEVRHQVAQTAATGVVRDVSGNLNASADCKRATDDLLDVSNSSGMVSWDHPDVAVLKAETCTALASWLMSDHSKATTEQLTAVHVLVHEAVHVRGERNEAVTECVAMTLDAKVARELGAPAVVADRMAGQYRTEVYPHLSAEYRTDCTTVVDGH